MEILIEKMDHLGSGIGFVDGKITFVPFSAVGDLLDIEIVKDNKNYSVGKIIKIIKPSNLRVNPFCKYFEKCGGCNLAHLSYIDTLKYKKSRVEDILKDYISGVEVIKNDTPLNYRNKVEFKIRNKRLGFYESKSHEIVEIDKCSVTKKTINNFIPEINNFNLTNADITVRCNYNDELLISITTKEEPLIKENYFGYKVVGIVLNDKCIYGEDHFIDKIGDFFFEVSYDSFFQVNSNINTKLFNILKDNIKGDNILDLYCGVGTLSIVASKNAKKVYGIEIIPNAIVNALKNAKINKADNVEFILGKVEDKIEFIKDDIDTVIVDPPRKGLDNKTIESIIKIHPERIIYISCDTQSLKKNLDDLQNYKVIKSYVMDMFSYSYHVESVVVLERIDE